MKVIRQPVDGTTHPASVRVLMIERNRMSGKSEKERGRSTDGPAFWLLKPGAFGCALRSVLRYV